MCQCDMLRFFDLFLNTSNHNCITIDDIPWMPLTLSFVFGVLECKTGLEMLSLLTYHRLDYSVLLDRPGYLCCKTWHDIIHYVHVKLMYYCPQNKGKTVLYYIPLGCKAFPYSKGVFHIMPRIWQTLHSLLDFWRVFQKKYQGPRMFRLLP